MRRSWSKLRTGKESPSAWKTKLRVEELETRLTPATAGIDFSAGFTAPAALQLNGGAAIVGSSLQITDGSGVEARSAFASTAQPIGAFSTQFQFRITGGSNPTADGLTFTIQGSGPTALGSSGGGLGFGPDSTSQAPGIPSSLAIKFDLYDNQGEGADSTGLYVKGAAPTNVGSLDMTGSVDLHSGDLMQATLTYDGSNLTETLKDTVTGGTFNHTYTNVNLSAIVGGPNANVGFTGGTGGLTANQSILNWTFTPTVTPPAPTLTPVLAIDAGGSAAGAFVADTDVSGGNTYTVSDAINTANVSNPAPQSVYQSERYGNFTYALPGLTPGASYVVRLHFAEIYWNAPGQRVFDVAINGQQVLTNFDILAEAGGKDIALVKEFTTTADANGQIRIQFSTLVDNAKVSGIEVLAVGQTAPPAPTGLVATAGNQQVALQWAASAGAASYNVYRSTTPGAETGPALATGVNGTSYSDITAANGTTYYYKVTAVNATGESVLSGEASGTPQAPPVTGAGLWIDAGGGAVGSYLADTDFSGGGTYSTGNAIDTSGVTNPAPLGVYQSERYGNFNYAVAGLTPGASYSVRLDFAEIYWTSPGQRVFNVAINGQTVLQNFDIVATAGAANKAVTETFTTTADSSGDITLQFTTIVDNAKVSGIEISPAVTPQPPPPPPPPPMGTAPTAPLNLTATPGAGQVSLAWTPSSGASAYDIYRSTTIGGEGGTPYQTGVTAASFTDTSVSGSTTYFYTVTAVNSAGASGMSNEDVATTVGAGGQIYYVSPNGNDANNGLSPGSAWQTVAKVDAMHFNPGDEILFARGGEWRESLDASSSGTAGDPIIWGAYGTGAKPKFWGSNVLNSSAFQSAGGNVYTLTSSQRIASVFVDHQFLLAANDVNGVQSEAGSWYWDGNTLWINTGGSDPRTDGKLYTAGVRVDAIYSNGQNHLVFEDLAADETADVNDGYGIRVMGSADVHLIYDDAYRGGRHNIGVINSTQVVSEGLYAAYAMPDIPGGYTLYVAFSDDSRSGDTSSWIDCVGDDIDPGQLVFYDHGNGLGPILIQNMISHGGILGIGGSTAQAPVTILGGEILDASLEIFGNFVTVDGMTLHGNAAIDNYGSNNLFQNMQLVGINPINGGPTGYWSAIVVRAGATNNVFRFNTVVLDPAAPGFATDLALVGSNSQTSLYGNILIGNNRVVKDWAGDIGNSDLTYVDYNLYKPGATFANSADVDTSLITWQAQGRDVHSLVGDPLFTNAAAGDYSLSAGSAAIGAANLGSSLTPPTDFLGKPRNPGAANIGAF